MLIAGGIILVNALRNAANFFYNPSEVLAENFEPESEVFNIGGLVVQDSLVRGEGLQIEFWVTDFLEEGDVPMDPLPLLHVSYDGILPDLFAEGEGVVVKGSLVEPEKFRADKLLAKHDENYQPVKK